MAGEFQLVTQIWKLPPRVRIAPGSPFIGVVGEVLSMCAGYWREDAMTRFALALASRWSGPNRPTGAGAEFCRYSFALRAGEKAARPTATRNMAFEEQSPER